MEEKDQKDGNEKPSGFYIPKRYVVCFMMFSGMLIMNCQRSCLSVAIVAMSSRTKHWNGVSWVSKVCLICRPIISPDHSIARYLLLGILGGHKHTFI